MPYSITVSEDHTIQYSPTRNAYWSLARRIGINREPSTELAPDSDVELVTSAIHHCHTVIIHNRTQDTYFMLHVSPQAFQKEPGLNSHSFYNDCCKPSYVELAASNYNEGDGLGITPESELDVIIVVNNENWSKGRAELILQKMQERAPCRIINSNIIITPALQQAYYYSVRFNVQTHTLRVESNNGIYAETYSNPLSNSQYDELEHLLPKEQRTALQANLREYNQEAITSIVQQIMISPRIDQTLETFLFENSRSLNEQTLSEAQQLIQNIEAILAQSQIPAADFGSPFCYELYKNLGFLYLVTENHEKASEYFIKVANYGKSMRKAEFNDDMKIFFCLAGVIAERSGDLNKAYDYYELSMKSGFLGQLEDIESRLRFARVAKALATSNPEILEELNFAKEKAEDLINQCNQASESDLPEKFQLLDILSGRLHVCEQYIQYFHTAESNTEQASLIPTL